MLAVVRICFEACRILKIANQQLVEVDRLRLCSFRLTEDKIGGLNVAVSDVHFLKGGTDVYKPDNERQQLCLSPHQILVKWDHVGVYC